MSGFTKFVHPALAVACPVCGAGDGTWCRRANNQPEVRLHRARQIEADKAFIDQYGQDAALKKDRAGWVIDRCAAIRD